ncbi:hypothetical protein ALC56_15343 [Trachymyrmex septentrionalis]|uniref:Uncharacterized protein n=1 Tax=Trachymyrmex septentrionalis TaxID=34720 RepID=A0A151JSN8_9HYME|nr:hypothetical protein ALC56_15343 [Trachymyrmex septentrionalis]
MYSSRSSRNKNPSGTIIHAISMASRTRCLNQEIKMTRRRSCIQSKLYEVYTISKLKIALSPYKTTNDTSYWTRRRRYCGGIGGYLCNIYVYINIYITIMYMIGNKTVYMNIKTLNTKRLFGRVLRC